MQVIESVAEFKAMRREIAGSVGLVPTMGYLHDGHLELARRARAENDVVAVSIFVNPTQFGPSEDFARYPSDPERDLALLRGVGADLVLLPPVADVYPPGFSTYVDVLGVTERLEGAARPGHFRGVATVVAKLFNIVAPTRAYFGQKDAQQVVVIKKMAKDLDMNLDIVVVNTVREADGLAMSSRNVYLTTEQRRAAPVLYRSLELARRLRAEGEADVGRIKAAMTILIATEPSVEVEYISVAHLETLEELDVASGATLVSLAARLGRTRLIDNVLLG